MSSLTKRRLLLLIASKGRERDLLSKGFTLVELMIVIVIVGILAAVALPNFINQSSKAKATEAKTNISAIIKQAQAKFTEDGLDPSLTAADISTNYGAPAAGTTKFDYTGAFSSATSIYTVTATGNSSDSGIKDQKIAGCVNFKTGLVKMSSQLSTTAPTLSCAAAG